MATKSPSVTFHRVIPATPGQLPSQHLPFQLTLLTEILWVRVDEVRVDTLFLLRQLARQSLNHVLHAQHVLVGHWAVAGLVDIDFNGNPRFADDPATTDTGCGVPVIVDMGAYEFQGAPATVKLADIDGDGAVAVPDLLTLLAAWGPTGGGCQLADIDLDGTVGVPDLLALLANWG